MVLSKRMGPQETMCRYDGSYGTDVLPPDIVRLS